MMAERLTEPASSLYSILSALLDYPQQDLIDALPDVEDALRAFPEAQHELAPLVAELRQHSLVGAQEIYVATFDRIPSHSLHLFEHVHGESRDRGQAMVDLLAEYRSHGLDMAVNELPDYVPLFLEVLALIDPQKSQALLDEAIHVLAAIGERLARAQSPYAGIFAVLRQLATVQPQPLLKPPVRDMDEALEVFGTGPDGVEPLLTPAATQTIRFHPRAAAHASERASSAPLRRDTR